jgi:NAD(P)-dependent dehydrogenase (short-subunit alcohol dehydrogenase family)
MDLQMNGKTALVSGGSAGIGKAIAFALAREGVDVAICARRKEPLEAAASQIARETNRKIVAIPADLTKPADAEAFVKDVHTALGRIDMLAPRSIPLQRIAECEEVASLVAYLASDLAHFINGTMIEIDGGQQKPLMDRFRDR